VVVGLDVASGLQWSEARLARLFERPASFSRLGIYDKAGTGVSDPIMHVPTPEERVEDVRIVMDAAGIEHAAVLGESEAGPVAAMFAATYPERTDALIIYGHRPPRPAHPRANARPRPRLPAPQRF